jgi:hypothetical protein
VSESWSAVDEDLDKLGGTNIDEGHASMVPLVTHGRSEMHDFADERACLTTTIGPRSSSNWCHVEGVDGGGSRRVSRTICATSRNLTLLFWE